MNNPNKNPKYIEGIKKCATSGNGNGNNQELGPDEKIIVNWLSKLSLLEGVPFQYLIPDIRMLPEESIRFFKIDPNWIDCLIDGAYSIGRSTTGDMKKDTSTLKIHKEIIHTNKANIRKAYLGLEETKPNAGNGKKAISGFLLRSGVVSGWPNLEVNGYSDQAGKNSINLLRFDRIAKDILICLFDDIAQRIRIHEPAEVLHFGVEMPEHKTDPVQKILKYVDKNIPGKEIKIGDEFFKQEVPFRDSKNTVVDLAQLASNIESKLKSNGNIGMTDDHPFTAAEFAMEMVQGVQEVDFIIN